MVLTEITMKIVIVIMITMMLKEKHPSLPLFLVGHSMGGMIALRCVIRNPELFDGFVLNGPLIVPGPQVGPLDLRSTPWRTYISRLFLGTLSYVIPEVCLGGPNLQIAMQVITRDKEKQAVLEKVMLLYAFVVAM